MQVKPMKTVDWERYGFKVGDVVRCTDSTFYAYEVGSLYLLDLGSDNDIVLDGSTLNGYDGEFELVTSAKEEKQMQYPYMVTGGTITVLFEDKVVVVHSTDSRFEPLLEHLKGTHDRDTLEELIDKPKQIARMTEGLVTVLGDQVQYAGEFVSDALALKLVDLLDAGFDARPWARFMDNLMKNPSYRSREQLYQFLERHGAPITPDGHFIAFKNVRQDFKDIHSGTFDNSPGQIVSMARHKVDDDQNRTCSTGLHACASPYLDHFYSWGSRTVVVKINPADVVSIPGDYDFAKMRVAQYEVLFEVDRAQVKEIEDQVVYTAASATLDDYDEQPWDEGYTEYDSYDSYDY